jgi:hypothetical protein
MWLLLWRWNRTKWTLSLSNNIYIKSVLKVSKRFSIYKGCEHKDCCTRGTIKNKNLFRRIWNFFHQTGEYVFWIGMRKIVVTHSLTESTPISHLFCCFVLRCHPCETKSLFSLDRTDRTKSINVVSHRWHQ